MTLLKVNNPQMEVDEGPDGEAKALKCYHILSNKEIFWIVQHNKLEFYPIYKLLLVSEYWKNIGSLTGRVFTHWFI